MKKIIFFLAMALLVCVNANAQITKWSKTYEKADELRGYESSTVISYVNIEDDVYFAIDCCSNHITIAIQTLKGIFNYNIIDGKKVTTALIGFYENDKLISKENVSLILHSEDSSMGGFINNDIAAKIINHLQKGNIRFVIKRTQMTSFDVVIPMNKNLLPLI